MTLQNLPIELHQHIAVYIESDKDLCAFTSTCRQTHAAVLTPGVWRKRFARRYDLSSGQSNQKLKQVYQWRAKILAQGTIFKDGQEAKEARCLELMRDLIVESFGTNSSVSLRSDQSHNLEQLHQIILRTNLLHIILRNGFNKPLTSKLLLTLQLALTHWSLDVKLQTLIFGWEISQQVVYQPINEAPIFSGTSSVAINIEWLLHAANFFKYHLTRHDQSLYDPFMDLEHHEKPRAWKGKIQNGVQNLSRYWKGVYAYLTDTDLERIRRIKPGRKIIIDVVEDQGIQDVEFDFSAHVNNIPWPEAFEVHLHSTDKKPFMDAHQSSVTAKPLRFEASGLDGPDCYGSGYIQDLPPFQGIPGWQRFTMMKYSLDEDGFWLENSLWAYEGCVLPGGQIILGRWWAPHADPAQDGDAYSGPFIFWCVGDDNEVDFGSDSGYGSNGSPT
ncbi:MAG: hypothetical protein M1812_001735 [Candelaria pacifica]|nr:MAG: hypothetical protein M1812_001735 [Candelaria pacifica]